MTDRCPTCRGPLAEPRAIEVCRRCHADLASAGRVPMRTTMEMPAMTPPGEPPAVPATRIGSVPPVGPHGCSWCGKPQDQVARLLTGQHASICDECVALCAAILADEQDPAD